jgi:hypothetical protein
MARNKCDKGQHLFSESPYYDDFELFESKFLNSKYEVFDIEYYYEAVKNWSDSKGAKMIDWVACARGFMLKDMRDNKAKIKKGYVKSNPEAQRIGSELNDLIEAKYGSRSVNKGQSRNSDGAGQTLF